MTTEILDAEPVRLEVCPIHDALVMIADSGQFVRRCPGCVAEAEHGIEILAALRRGRNGV